MYKRQKPDPEKPTKPDPENPTKPDPEKPTNPEKPTQKKYKVIEGAGLSLIHIWATLSTYFKYPEAVRRLIYTTNAIEGFNRQLRKVTKSKAVFPSDDSLLKMLYLRCV